MSNLPSPPNSPLPAPRPAHHPPVSLLCHCLRAKEATKPRAQDPSCFLHRHTQSALAQCSTIGFRDVQDRGRRGQAVGQGHYNEAWGPSSDLAAEVGNVTLDTGAMYVGRGTGAGPSGMGGPSLSQLAPPNVTRSMPVPGKGGPGDFGDSVMSIDQQSDKSSNYPVAGKDCGFGEWGVHLLDERQ